MLGFKPLHERTLSTPCKGIESTQDNAIRKVLYCSRFPPSDINDHDARSLGGPPLRDHTARRLGGQVKVLQFWSDNQGQPVIMRCTAPDIICRKKRT
jgi:hypothetical protein